MHKFVRDPVVEGRRCLREIPVFRTLVALLLVTGRAVAQRESAPVTLHEALEMAKQSAIVRAADGGVIEAEANLRAASLPFRDNPELEIDAGPRRRPSSGTSLQRTLVLEQPFELGGRRQGRVARARADLAAAIADRDVAVRQFLREVALAYIEAVDAEGRARLAQENQTIAAELLHIAERRFAVGDIPILDVNLARVALAQSRSDLLVAEGLRERAGTRLKARLTWPPSSPLPLEPADSERLPSLEWSALADRSETPEVRRREAEVRQAEADLQVAAGMRWPNFALRAEESQEEDSHILLGGVRFSLPIFNRGAGERAAAKARLDRARLELGIAQQTALADLRGAFAQYQRQRAAVEELRLNAAPLLADNVRLAQRSYEVGEIDLAEVLIIRRETLDARSRYLDRLREAEETAVDLQSRAGWIAP